MNDLKLKSLLIRHEGLRLKPYMDTAVPPRITIGVGRNLSDVGISESEAYGLLEADIARAKSDVSAHIPFFAQLDEVRQAALVDLAFNLGIGGLLQFHHFLADLQDGHYQIAAQDLLNSLWAKQVGSRAGDIATMVAKGTWV